MKRRQLLGLGVGAVASTAIIGATAPPAQAFLPLWLRLLLLAARARKKNKTAQKNSVVKQSQRSKRRRRKVAAQ
jgi:hypothetical protein